MAAKRTTRRRRRRIKAMSAASQEMNLTVLERQERAVLEATELVCRLMEERGMGRPELARRLGRTRGELDRLLDGRATMTVRTLSDALAALGRAVRLRDEPLDDSPLLCEHANECPATCPCQPGCYCRTRGSCIARMSLGADNDDPLDGEIDIGSLRGGVRGKYCARMREGTNLVLLAPDVYEHFRDADSVNDVLRKIIRIGLRQRDAVLAALDERPKRRKRRSLRSVLAGLTPAKLPRAAPARRP